MNSFGLNTNLLPVSGLKKEVLVEAQEILRKLSAAIEEM